MQVSVDNFFITHSHIDPLSISMSLQEKPCCLLENPPTSSVILCKFQKKATKKIIRQNKTA
jgi:hypothetical protein